MSACYFVHKVNHSCPYCGWKGDEKDKSLANPLRYLLQNKSKHQATDKEKKC